MIAKDFVPYTGIKSFAIMKYLVRDYARKSHPPPRTHYPRIPDAFTAGHVIVCSFPPDSGGKLHTIMGAVKEAAHDASSRDGNHAGYFPAAP